MIVLEYVPEEPTRIEDMDFTYNPAVRGVKKKDIPKVLEGRLEELSEAFDRNPSFRNNFLPTFEGITPKGTVKTGRTRFKQYFLKRELMREAKVGRLEGTVSSEAYHRLNRTLNVLSTIHVTTTADGYSVFGHRKGEHLPNTYLSPAGFLDFNSDYSTIDLDPRDLIMRNVYDEISEELGYEGQMDVHVSGICRDTEESFLSCFVTHVDLPVGYREVERLWRRSASAKKEHAHLIYVRDELRELRALMTKRFNGVGNPEQNILFIRGVPNGGDERYGLIENGVGSIILHVAQRWGRDAARTFSSRMHYLVDRQGLI